MYFDIVGFRGRNGEAGGMLMNSKELEKELEGLYQKSSYISELLDESEINVRQTSMEDKKLMAADALRRIYYETKGLEEDIQKLRERLG